MKRRLAGIVALGMALTLTFGMTVSAAPSSDTEKFDPVIDASEVEKPDSIEFDESKANEVTERTEVKVEVSAPQTYTNAAGESAKVESGKITITDSTGKAEEVSIKIEPVAVKEAEVKKVNETLQTQSALNQVKAAVKSSSAIKQAFATELEKDSAKVQIKPLTPVSLEPDNATKEAIKKVAALGGSVPVAVKHPDVVDGKFYLIMHIKEDGEIEYLGPAKCVNGSVTVGFSSLSPVVPIEVTLVGETVDSNTNNEPAGDSHWEGGPDYDPNDGNGDTATSGPVSPKTGEVLPLVGFMAVICLAGAVVSVRKARN